jgi:hypothetical protein
LKNAEPHARRTFSVVSSITVCRIYPWLYLNHPAIHIYG